jgi:class 3 adenylate cyclase/tetratricopeptide (TPR) repeat protein
VLFADLVGSTGLIEGLDAEEADAFLQRSVGAMRTAVNRYGGVVNGLQGDGVMALFGAPVAHEDHAVRACLAALDMRELVTAATHGAAEVRVGLHAGEVVVRSVGGDLSADYVATGSTVHLAARMEAAATPGVPLVTADVARLADGFVELRPREKLSVKGFELPVSVFDVVGRTAARSSWDVRRTQQLTQLAGRRHELAVLAGAAELAATAGIGRVIGVEGDPGVGKSRLVHELLSSKPERLRVLRAATSPYDTNTAFLPIVQLLDGLLPAADSPSARVTALGEDLEDAAPGVAFVLDPQSATDVGGMDASRRRRFVRDAIRRVFERASRRRPLLVVIEDLHWMDRDSVAVIGDLLDTVDRHPLLVVLTYRREFRHDWGARHAFEEIVLEPLSGPDGRRMATSLLGNRSTLDDVAALLMERTGGVPLFMEEAVRDLIDRGALTGPIGDLRLAASVEEIEVPDGVRTVLASRVDRLPVDAKELVQTASVIGPTVPVDLLVAVSDTPAASVVEGLEVLVAADLLEHGDAGTVVFRHDLVREVTYGEIPHARRREVHGTVLDVLIDSGDESEHLERLAVHASRAGRWAQAAEFGLAAARRAEGRSSYEDAERFLQSALEALHQLPRDEEVSRAIVDTHVALRVAGTGAGHRMDTLLDGLAEAEVLAAELGDVDRLAVVNLHRSYIASTIGDHTSAVGAARKARVLGERLTARQVIAEAILAEAQALVMAGRPAPAIEMLLPEVDFFRSEMTGRHGMVGHRATWCLMHLADAYALTGRFYPADRYGQEALEVAASVGRPFDISYASLGRGNRALASEQHAEAFESFVEAREIALRHDLRWASALAGAFLGGVLVSRGELERAGDVLADARRESIGLGARLVDGWLLVHRAALAVAEGEERLAGTLAGRAVDMAAHGHQLTLEIAARRVLASADRDRATEELRTAEAAARREGLVPLLAGTLAELAVLGIDDAAREAGELREQLGLRRPSRRRRPGSPPSVVR